MASSITYGEGMSKLQLAFDYCLSLPGKLKGDPCEMSLKEMLVKVSVVEDADIEAIGTLIGIMAKLGSWKAAMMQFNVNFPKYKHGPANRKICFQYWNIPHNLLKLVPPDKFNTRIMAAAPVPQIPEQQSLLSSLTTVSTSSGSAKILSPLYCKCISNKRDFFAPNADSYVSSVLDVIWMCTVLLWRSTNCFEKLPIDSASTQRCANCERIKKHWKDEVEGGRESENKWVEFEQEEAEAGMFITK